MEQFIKTKLISAVVSPEVICASYPSYISVNIIDIIESYRRDILDKEKQEFYSIKLSKKFLRTPKYVQALYFNWKSFVAELNYIVSMYDFIVVNGYPKSSEHLCINRVQEILKRCSRLAQFCPYNTYYVSKSCKYYDEIKQIRKIIQKLSDVCWMNCKRFWCPQEIRPDWIAKYRTLAKRNLLPKYFNLPKGEIWVTYSDHKAFWRYFDLMATKLFRSIEIQQPSSLNNKILDYCTII